MTVALLLVDEVASALRLGEPVVALETTLVSHGFSGGRGPDAAQAAEQRVRAHGAIPATIGVVGGAVRVGLDAAELERFAEAGPAARKVGARDLAACAVQGALGATTAGGTLAVCASAGIRFMGTGGIGGVHRGFAQSLDISGDLPQLARTAAVVVCSGAKSILDVAATAELLETLGVPVLGWQTRTLPLFYSADGGPPVSATVSDAAEVAGIAAAALAAEPRLGPAAGPAACRRTRPGRGDHGGSRPRAPGRGQRTGGDSGGADDDRGTERRPQRGGEPGADRRQRGARRPGGGRLRSRGLSSGVRCIPARYGGWQSGEHWPG